MKPLAGVGNGVRLVLTIGAITLLGSLPAANGTNLFWSGNGTTQGGAGTWNTTAPHFDPVATALPAALMAVTWVNANVDSAEFGGMPAAR